MKNKTIENDEATDFCWARFYVFDNYFVGAFRFFIRNFRNLKVIVLSGGNFGIAGVLRSVIRNFANLKAIVLSGGNFGVVVCNLAQFIALSIHSLGIWACFGFVRLVLTGPFFTLGGNLL